MLRRPLGPGSSRPHLVRVQVRGVRVALWCGPWYLPVRCREAHVFHGGAWVLSRDHPEVLSMPRALSGEVTSGQLVSRSAPKSFERFPELASWLRDAAYSDGKPVGMVQLSVRPKGAVYVLTLRIQDQGGMMLQVEDASLDDALVLLEACLTANPTPWTRDPYPLGQLSGKKR